jgi:hypothetical protein
MAWRYKMQLFAPVTSLRCGARRGFKFDEVGEEEKKGRRQSGGSEGRLLRTCYARCLAPGMLHSSYQ